jgi:hypothetical protein
MLYVKLCPYLLLSVFISLPIWAQVDQSVIQTTKDVTDIVTNSSMQSNTSIAKEASKLEDLIDKNECSNEIETHDSCQGFANSLVPQGLKEKGWKTLLEIKYTGQLIQEKEAPPLQRITRAIIFLAIELILGIRQQTLLPALILMLKPKVFRIGISLAMVLHQRHLIFAHN